MLIKVLIQIESCLITIPLKNTVCSTYFKILLRGKPKWSDMIDDEMRDLFWKPIIGFRNLQLIKRNSGLGNHKMKQYYYVRNKHTFIMREDVKITFTCNFNFKDYPFDSHECDLVYYCENGEEREIILNTTYSITILEDISKKINAQDHKKLIIPNTTTPFIVSVEIIPNKTMWGIVSSTGLRINLQRNSIALLMGSFYVPTGIFAILSMASYVINPEVVSFNN